MKIVSEWLEYELESEIIESAKFQVEPASLSSSLMESAIEEKERTINLIDFVKRHIVDWNVKAKDGREKKDFENKLDVILRLRLKRTEEEVEKNMNWIELWLKLLNFMQNPDNFLKN